MIDYLFHVSFFLNIYSNTKIHLLLLLLISIYLSLLTYLVASPIAYDNVRDTSYYVSCDHQAITINSVRIRLISGTIHYPRSRLGM